MDGRVAYAFKVKCFMRVFRPGFKAGINGCVAQKGVPTFHLNGHYLAFVGLLQSPLVQPPIETPTLFSEDTCSFRRHFLVSPDQFMVT